MNDDNPKNEEQTQDANVQNDRVLHEESNSSLLAQNRRPTMSEDWLAVWIGGLLLTLSLVAVLMNLPASYRVAVQSGAIAGSLGDTAGSLGGTAGSPSSVAEEPITNPLKPLLTKPSRWTTNPIDAIYPASAVGILGVLAVALGVFGIGAKVQGCRFAEFAPGFLFVFSLALAALTLAAQTIAKQYNLEYALWALAIGLLLSNTIGTPNWVRPAVRTEFYIKTGLVLLGAKVLFSRLLELGPPGLCVAWVVTPVVLITTYWFGQQVLKIPSKSLTMVLAADMSVCGVSSAIATASACKAKKEELSLVIGISLSFTVLMMVIMPWVVRATGMNEVVGGAWIGGTIDSSGAVVAAGELVSPAAGFAAVTIKMIQNILIGVVAFGVAMYWVGYVESDGSETKPKIAEIWHRFPKFILGFLAASAMFSIFHATLYRGPEIVTATLKGGSETLRSWFFALAFVSIGLDSNFRELGKYLRGGKPLLLYICGQTLNLCLTLAMAWLVFEVIFPDVTARIAGE